MATDLTLEYKEPPATPPYPYAGFDWEGFYAGVGFGSTGLTSGGPADQEYQFQGIAGFNFLASSVVLGAEVYAEYVTDFTDSTTAVGAEARAGYLVTDDMLVYAALGLHRYQPGGVYATGSIGAEFVVGDSSTIDVKYSYLDHTNGPFWGHKLSASWNWHFE
ncbi:outer membrane protein [Cucumibacter marinus]|uniref:outer membrane protein n=1 Tax=Cucumibacter marinus TaxID=1121252 RepID=UPI0003FA6324|nr:hypothetical protein [Cucumibacter marinus]